MYNMNVSYNGGYPQSSIFSLGELDGNQEGPNWPLALAPQV